MADPKILAIDLGTSAVKSIVISKDGIVLGWGSAENPILQPKPDWTEQSPDDWWLATITSVRNALHESGVTPKEIAGIGLSGQMHGTVLLDDSGLPICPAVIWPDRRSRRQVSEITRHIGAEQLVQITGSPVVTGFQAATIRWFMEEEPALWSRVAMILTPKDYLRWRLTDRFQSEPSDGSGTLLFNTSKRDWSLTILNMLDIDASRLPPVASSETVSGHLSSRAAAELGLETGTPVSVGAADTACGLVGSGVVNSRSLLITLGTGGQIVQPASAFQPDPSSRIHTFCSALRPSPLHAGWYQMAAILTAGMALRWLRDQVFALKGDEVFGQMMAMAQNVEIGAGGLLFVPYLTGERTPHMNPLARGLFLGLTNAHCRADMIRSVMEGVVLACYDAYSVLHEFGKKPDGIILAGGASQSILWQQMISDVFDLPVRPLAIIQQSALGAAMLMGTGLGLFNLEDAVERWTRYGPVIEPDASRHAIYMRLLALFRSAYQGHREDFQELWNLETSTI